MSKIRLLAGIGLLAVLAVGVLYGIGYWPVHAGATAPKELIAESTPKAAPAVAFGDAAGARHALADYKGHYVLLNLWATYCAPCVGELPALAKLKDAVPGLQVVAVDVGRDAAPVAGDFLKSHDAGALGTYVDSDIALIAAFKAYALPITVLIDPSGNVVARTEGVAPWDAPETIAYFKKLAAGA